MQTSVAAIAALMILIAAPLRAQSGFFLGPHATGASLPGKDSSDPLNVGSGTPLDFGARFGAHAGLSFRHSLGRSYGLLLNFDRTIPGAKTGDVDLGQWDFLGRMSFVNVGPAMAYFTAGLSKSAVKSSFSDRDSGRSILGGMAPTAGVTGQFLVTSRLAVEAGVLWTAISFTDDYGHSASRIDRLTLGLSYYPFGRAGAAQPER